MASIYGSTEIMMIIIVYLHMRETFVIHVRTQLSIASRCQHFRLDFNPFKPGVDFMGQRHTVVTQISRHKTRRLIFGMSYQTLNK